MREGVKEFLWCVVMFPVALLLAALTYLDWYVFGNLPKRKF